MKLFLLLTDLAILGVYGGYHLINHQASFSHILVVLLFFFAARVLALAVHPLFTLANLAALYFLQPYHLPMLLAFYLFYILLYFFLSRKEQQQLLLTQENTRLKVDKRNNLRYQLLRENYDNQLSLNLRLEERRQIAQQIHDLLGHSLTASALQLEAATELMDQSPERAKTLLRSAAGQLREGISQVRHAVHQMRPDVPGMKASELQSLIDRFRLNSGIATYYQQEGDLNGLPVVYWNALIGNLREALTNILRHAAATQVEIRLQALPGVIRLEVKDNGRGVQHFVEGMGISGMRERAAALGGSLIVRSEQGMTVITLIPRKEMDDDTLGSC